jgi:hypothetical protein
MILCKTHVKTSKAFDGSGLRALRNPGPSMSASAAEFTAALFTMTARAASNAASRPVPLFSGELLFL